MEFSKYGLVLGKCEYPFPYIFKLGTPKIKLNIKSKPIYNHEKIHFNQYKRDNFHIFKLIFSKQYRLECELEAYTEQIKYFNLKSLNSTQWIIKNIIDKHKINIDRNYIKKRIKYILKRRKYIKF
jgi:hypothetical protein